MHDDSGDWPQFQTARNPPTDKLSDTNNARCREIRYRPARFPSRATLSGVRHASWPSLRTCFPIRLGLAQELGLCVRNGRP